MKTFFKDFQGYRAYKKLPKLIRILFFTRRVFKTGIILNPLLNGLLNQQIAVTYVTSDEKDPGLLKQSTGYRSIYIGKGFFLGFYFFSI